MTANNSDSIFKEAVNLAEKWQNRANELITKEEKAYQNQMKHLLNNPDDKVTLTRMIDQSFRTRNYSRVADQVTYILKRYGIPGFFNLKEKTLIHLFLSAGRFLPGISVPKMIENMRKSSKNAIIPGEPEIFTAHLEKRKSQGVRMNINHLGEAVLGEDEAAHRLITYIKDLKSPDIEYISVKISTIYSQISSLSFEHTVNVLVERLSKLYQAASENMFTRANGEKVFKFVNLDMEEYRDLSITTEAFMRALNQPQFKNHSAGIVLQAYLPDSLAIQKKLTEWAKERVASGGAPIKIRIVKGANMEMELVESSLFNWPLAPFDNKQDVDANYKLMVSFGLTPENVKAVHLGIASHNLFELAYAYCLAKKNGVTKSMTFEMLEGMANHVRRAISELTGEVLLYAPIAGKEEFINAIAYLMRRLDENTSKENFLRYAPGITTKSYEWAYLKNQFENACRHMDKVKLTPNRIQDRNTETFPEKMGALYEGEFNNEPDTDWSLPANRIWAEAIRGKWMKSPDDAPIEIPLVINGEEIFEDRSVKECLDPSQKPVKVVVAHYRQAIKEDIEKAVAVAKNDPDGWRAKSLDERAEVLSKVAMEIRKSRGDLIGAASANTGKVFIETDVEVSEAIDFAEYYPYSAKVFDTISTLDVKPKGVGAVVSPWNFPVAIPCGGIVAALSAGNTVLFKPASDAVLTAWVLCNCFWNAGISKNVLQFIPCSGGEVGASLISHKDVDFVILTGGTETGMAMLKQKPEINLSAETGGKNATIVTSMGDRDQAIKNVIHSAFGNSGQKCSATSLLILEKEIYDDENFKRQLADATSSMHVGSSWDFSNKIGALIKPPSGDLKRALTTLEPFESWALEPRQIQDNPHMWTPGIKYGVTPGSCTHMTEFFGSLLGVMRADNLDHAIKLVNMTGFGLTSSLESLDIREQEKWKANIKSGNLYINRGSTGAITLRQPFGGMGKSALGPAIKAGGPNYVSQFMNFTEKDFPRITSIGKEHALLRMALQWRQKINWGRYPEYTEDLNKTIRAIKSYVFHWEQEFSLEKDYFHLRGQDNIHRYRPLGTVSIRIHEKDSLFETLARIAAARITNNVVIISIPPELENNITNFFNSVEGSEIINNSIIRRQNDDAFIASFAVIDRVRYAAPERVPAKVLNAAAEKGFYIARNPVLMEGRLELLHYVENQSVCDTYHRYGNIGDRTEI